MSGPKVGPDRLPPDTDRYWSWRSKLLTLHAELAELDRQDPDPLWREIRGNALGRVAIAVDDLSLARKILSPFTRARTVATILERRNDTARLGSMIELTREISDDETRTELLAGTVMGIKHPERWRTELIEVARGLGKTPRTDEVVFHVARTLNAFKELQRLVSPRSRDEFRCEMQLAAGNRERLAALLRWGRIAGGRKGGDPDDQDPVGFRFEPLVAPFRAIGKLGDPELIRDALQIVPRVDSAGGRVLLFDLLGGSSLRTAASRQAVRLARELAGTGRDATGTAIREFDEEPLRDLAIRHCSPTMARWIRDPLLRDRAIGAVAIELGDAGLAEEVGHRWRRITTLTEIAADTGRPAVADRILELGIAGTGSDQPDEVEALLLVEAAAVWLDIVENPERVASTVVDTVDSRSTIT